MKLVNVESSAPKQESPQSSLLSLVQLRLVSCVNRFECVTNKNIINFCLKLEAIAYYL